MIGTRQIISGELHYPRIPPEYWSARFEMARAMGLNTVSTYVFWNLHEEQPGAFDFSHARDVARFVRLAAGAGLDVILRPGPYICAEWDFGGLPAWLLAGEPIRLRSTDERYMAPVRRWLRRLGSELAELMRPRGGPIVAVQLENEYGAFGNDKAYLRALRAALEEAGIGGVPFYTIDQPRDALRGGLPELPVALTFGPGDPQGHFASLRAARPDAPLLCGEYWAGWFDHWGEPHQRGDDAQQARDLAWMLGCGANVNIYMFHGGTNFGFSNGANASGSAPYQPTTTSYDYLAALDETGRPTSKYDAFRTVIAAHTKTQPPPVARTQPVRRIPVPPLDESAPLAQALGDALRGDGPLAMEALGQSFGYVLYRTHIAEAGNGELELGAVRDYAVVCVDGRAVGHLDRRLGETGLRIEHVPAGTALDILIENGGRINYGPDFPFERKGLTGEVRWNGAALRGWSMWRLDFRTLPEFRFTRAHHAKPSFRRGTFELGEPADTYIEVGTLGKGTMWVNGHHAGRFWNIGPQQSLYVPAPWLRSGRNDVVVFELR